MDESRSKGGTMSRLLCTLLLITTFVANTPAQTGDILPADNLVVEGIPPIPAQLAKDVGRYTEFRSAAITSWHPLKHEMLIMTRFGDVPQVHYLKMPGGARTQMTFFTDRLAGASFNPKSDDYFVFSKDVGGGEWFQNYRFDLATGTVTLLTDGKSRNQLGVFSKDGRRMAYGSTRRNGKDIDFYTIDPQDPSTNRMFAQLENGEAWEISDWSEDGSKILASQEVSANESYVWLFDPATGEKKLLTPKQGDEQVAYQGAIFRNDGKGFYTVTDRGSEFLRLAYVDLATLKHEYITADIPWDVDDVAVSRDGSLIAFVTNENGLSVLHLMDARTKKALPVPKLPVGLIFGLQFHPDGTLLAFNMGSARSSTDIYTLDLKTQKVERWTYSETGGLNVDNFPEPQLITWKSFDGMTISGFVYRPPSKFTGKRPVMVNIHGGPEGEFRPGFLGRNNYYLNEMGVAIIFPNVRGSSGFGKTFLKLDNGFKRQDSYKDIDALLDWIKQQPDLDGDRIMITGGSYGGFMTLAVATNYNDKIRCSLPVVGPSNFVTFLQNTEAYRRDLRRVEYGDERDPKMREYLEKIAPLNNADRIRKPMMIVQGKNDPRVPYTESEQMLATLKKQQTPVWYLLAKDEGHGFAKKKNADYQFYATVMFMKNFLLEPEITGTTGK
jgi:dipeptidyl aminopeptidase/acylaminoacyl peptidase